MGGGKERVAPLLIARGGRSLGQGGVGPDASAPPWALFPAPAKVFGMKAVVAWIAKSALSLVTTWGDPCNHCK